MLAKLFARLFRRNRPQHSLFIPVVDEEGNVTGFTDSLMVEYLESQAPNPTQDSLEELFEEVTRIRVIDGGMAQNQALGTDVLLDISDPQALTVFRDCLKIVEDESTFGHCMCLGDQALEFYAGRKLKATIGLHHGQSIRWDAWKHDAQLQDGRRLLVWLADRGVTAPLEVYEEDQRQAEEYRQAMLRWQQAMPKCLLPFWDQMQASTRDIAPLLQALESEYPDVEARILWLFKWYGSGKGPWNGFPAYESAPERLLLEFPTNQLVATLTQHPLTPTHLEGAARYFAGYHFNTQRQPELQQLPQELTQRLLEHSLKSTDEDKIRLAKQAFID